MTFSGAESQYLQKLIKRPKIRKTDLNKLSHKYKFKLCLLSEKDEGVIYKFLVNIKGVRKELANFKFIEDLDSADIILVYVKNEAWGWNTIKTLRSQPKHFLKPLLLDLDEQCENMTELVDDTLILPVNQAALLDKLQSLFKISAKICGLAELPESMGEISLRKILLLRYLYTRESYVLHPNRNFQSSVGYTFPIVQLLFNVNSGKEVVYIESLEEAQLLTSKLVDKINICPFCEHTQINYRELCPHCRSLNINEEATIHHFRCAYVGKESEFRRGLKLECPKCSHELRHIGVDYDKPAEVLWCNHCNHNFIDPLLSCFCLVCANTFTPEDAFIKLINECTLSQEGYRAAEEGALPGYGLINILKKELGFYKREVFMEYLRIEVFRCRRYKYNSTLANINLKGADEVLGEDSLKYSRKLKSDFAAIINGTFRSTDLFTDLSNGEILIIFTNTDFDNAKTALNRLSQSLNALIEKKLNIDYSLLELAVDDNRLEGIWEKLN